MRAKPPAMPTEATMLSRSLSSSSSSTRPRSTPSVNVAAVTASVMSSARSWLPSAKRPSAATAFCWRARRASCSATRVRSLTSRATTSRDSTVVVGGVHRHRLDGERHPVAGELEGSPLARQRGVVVLEAELEHVLRDLGVQLGHPAAAEHARVEEAEAPDRVAVGDQDPQVVIEEEDGRVGQVAGQRAVQRLRVADQLLGLLARGGVDLAVGHVLGGEVQDAVDGDRRPVQEPVVAAAGAIAVLEGDHRVAVRVGEGGGPILRRRDVVGVDEGDERLRHQLLAGPAEPALPGRVELREVAVDGGAEHVDGQLEEPLDCILRWALRVAGHLGGCLRAAVRSAQEKRAMQENNGAISIVLVRERVGMFRPVASAA